MRVGSLFSGIGGFELGFERAGFDIAFQVEIDPWCRRVLAKHWPNVKRYEDVRHVGSHNLEWVDVLIGGFPCQDISIAGKGAGIDGERSGLWKEYVRIIRELRPSYVVVENVPALLHRGLDRVLGDLAARGYDAEWQVLSAAAFGAPHIRERLFILAHANSAGSGSSHRNAVHEGWATRESWGESLQETTGWAPGATVGNSRPAGALSASRVGHAVSVGRIQGGDQKQEWQGFAARGASLRRSEWWQVEPNVGRVANGVPFGVHRLRGLGNAVVPQVAQYVAECVKAHAEATGQWIEAA